MKEQTSRIVKLHEIESKKLNTHLSSYLFTSLLLPNPSHFYVYKFYVIAKASISASS